jgi:hypothetical protein
MRIWQWVVAGVAMLSAACGSGASSRVTATRAAEIDREVRAFAQTVAHDVSHEGPAAWDRHFSESPAFFMASDGHLVFANRASATAGIQDLVRGIKQIDLQWGSDLRVDPLAPDLAVLAAPYHEILTDAFGNRVDVSGYFTGIAEYNRGRWQLRDAHWSSVVASPPAVR